MDLNRFVAGSTWRHPQKINLQVGTEKIICFKTLVSGINDTVPRSNFSFGTTYTLLTI